MVKNVNTDCSPGDFLRCIDAIGSQYIDHNGKLRTLEHNKIYVFAGYDHKGFIILSEHLAIGGWLTSRFEFVDIKKKPDIDYLQLAKDVAGSK